MEEKHCKEVERSKGAREQMSAALWLVWDVGPHRGKGGKIAVFERRIKCRGVKINE